MFRRRSSRRWVALAVWGVLPALSVAVPMLDSGHPARMVVLEAEHDPSVASFTHDHTICVLYASNLSHPAGPTELERQMAPAVVPLASGEHGVTPAFPDLPNSRAPPLV